MSTNSASRSLRRGWDGQGRSEPLLAPSTYKTTSRLKRQAHTLDDVVSEALRPVALPGLRVLLGLLFVWFGALKVFGASPVESLVAGTLPWFDPALTVLMLGAAEVVLGLGLVVGVAVRLVLAVLVTHLCGTFLTFVMLPELMFRQHNPLLLTESGEFVTKNLVLIGATLVLMTHTRHQSAASRTTQPTPTATSSRIADTHRAAEMLPSRL